MKRLALAAMVFTVVAAGAVAIVRAQQPPVADGAAVYKERCATCHDGTGGDASRAPNREALRTRSVDQIVAALASGGIMAVHGATMSEPEKRAVATFLSGGGSTAAAAGRDPNMGKCAAAAPALGTRAQLAKWNGWGNDPSNGRFQDAAAAGLNAQSVPQLTLKWAFAFPNATAASAQPTVYEGRVFAGSEAGGVWALDLASGCTYWKFDTEAGVRSAVVIERISQNPARYAALFGDFRSNVYAVDAQTGALIWKMRADEHPSARITGAPSVHANRVYVAVSSVEEVPASRPNYPCCTFRGSVIAFDAPTGKKLWQTFMIPEPPAIAGKNTAGTPLWKAAGAAIWSSPTIDVAKSTVYVGTGNAYTTPAAAMTDALVALDMNTGAIRWFNQLTPNDSFVMNCRAGNENCPTDVGPDHDFGSSPILRTVGGKRLLLIGQKSGVIYGLDPDDKGKVLWQQRVGKGSELGGIEWGPAADNANVYVAVSDVIAQGTGRSENPGGLHALKIADGTRVWYTAAAPLTCKPGPGCSGAQSAAISVIPGVVFSGSIDGHLRAFASDTGRVIWDYDTMHEYETVNGVKGTGGSIDGAGPVIVGGMVLSNSGYGRFLGKPGNVLLAFGAK